MLSPPPGLHCCCWVGARGAGIHRHMLQGTHSLPVEMLHTCLVTKTWPLSGGAVQVQYEACRALRGIMEAAEAHAHVDAVRAGQIAEPLTAIIGVTQALVHCACSCYG